MLGSRFTGTMGGLRFHFAATAAYNYIKSFAIRIFWNLRVDVPEYRLPRESGRVSALENDCGPPLTRVSIVIHLICLGS